MTSWQVVTSWQFYLVTAILPGAAAVAQFTAGPFTETDGVYAAVGAFLAGFNLRSAMAAFVEEQS